MLRNSVLAAVAAVFFVVSCSQGEPGKQAKALTPSDPGAIGALNDFYRAAKSGEQEKALAMVLEPSDERVKQRLQREIAKTAEFLESGALDIRTFVSSRKGRWAVVVTRVRMTRAGETNAVMREEFLFQGEDRKWKVVPEGVRSDPAIRPLIDQDFQELFQWYRKEQEGFAKQFLNQ